MEKKITYSIKGTNLEVGLTSVIRSLPNKYVNSVGPFVFLDQIPEKAYSTTEYKQHLKEISGGRTAHPHRGIATFTYALKGAVEHYDSRGNRATVQDGGIQWMKAGNGVIHDELLVPTEEPHTVEYGMQFWLNLPAEVKKEKPEYLAIQSEEIPVVQLKNNAGLLKVLIGTFANKTSKISTHTKSLLYHVILNPGQSTIIEVDQGNEIALALTKGIILVNGQEAEEPDLISFDIEGNEIKLENKFLHKADALIFGGKPITEKLVFGGPFVMNSDEEIREAYRDYHSGKYGTITY